MILLRITEKEQPVILEALHFFGAEIQARMEVCLQKGDRVIHAEDPGPKGTIVSLDESVHGNAAVKWDDGETIVHAQDDLESWTEMLTTIDQIIDVIQLTNQKPLC